MPKIDLFGPKEEKPPEEKVALIIQEANTLKVTNSVAAEMATAFDQRCRGLIKEITDHHKPIIDSINESLKKARSKRNELLEPLENARTIVKQNLSDWLISEKQRIAKEQQEADRIRVEKEAELRKKYQTRIQTVLDENKSSAEKIELLESQLESADENGAAIIRSAIQVLESTGEDPSTVAAMMNENIHAEVATSTPTVAKTEKVKGLVGREKYTVEVLAMETLCRAIGEGKVPPGCVTPAKGALNQLAKALQGKPIPGCKINTTIAAHTRK